MLDGTNAVIYSGGALQDRLLDAKSTSVLQNDATNLLGDFWSITNNVVSGQQVSYTMTRSTTPDAGCPQCFAFDPNAISMDIMMVHISIPCIYIYIYDSNTNDLQRRMDLMLPSLITVRTGSVSR